MPVTAKLSLKFYEKLGEDVANELVNWFNEVDATYRSELKELNDANFSRFDAKLEQRFAESDARWEKRMADVDRRWAALDAKIDRSVVELRAEMKAGFAELRQQVAGLQAEFIKWTFVFWLGTIGLVLLLLRFPGGSV